MRIAPLYISHRQNALPGEGAEQRRQRGRLGKVIALVLAGAMLACVLTACGDKTANQPQPISVSSKDVTDLTSLKQLPSAPTLSNTITLPAGSMVELDTDHVAAVRSLTGKPHPLTQVSLLDISTNESTVVLPQGAGNAEGYDITDARASDTALVWVETKSTSGQWRVYRADLNGKTLGKAQLLATGNSTKNVPGIAVWKSMAIWQDCKTPAAREKGDVAYVYGSESNAKSKITLFSVNYPMIAAPEVAGNILTFTAYVTYGSNTQSEIHAMDLTTRKEVDTLVLPSPIQISDAIYLDGAFSFSVPAKYSDVGPLGNVGTYVQTGAKSFIRCPRAPLDTPTKAGAYFVVKNGKSVDVINGKDKSFRLILPTDDAPDYGEYLAGHGLNSKIVLFTQRTTASGAAGNTVVRVFQP